MRFVKDKKAVSPVVGVMLMLVVTIILAAVVSSFSGGLATDESKSPQLAISAKTKFGDSIVVHHESGDPISLGAIEVRIFCPEGDYADVSWKVNLTDTDNDKVPDAFHEIGNDNGVLETGEFFKINWSDVFNPNPFYPTWSKNPWSSPYIGEKVIIEIYEKGGDKPIAKTTTIVRP